MFKILNEEEIKKFYNWVEIEFIDYEKVDLLLQSISDGGDRKFVMACVEGTCSLKEVRYLRQTFFNNFDKTTPTERNWTNFGSLYEIYCDLRLIEIKKNKVP